VIELFPDEEVWRIEVGCWKLEVRKLESDLKGGVRGARS
jgi:hypothetical protein